MLSGPEVRNKVAEDMADAEIWEDRAYSFREEIKPPPTAVVTAKGTVITIPPAAAQDKGAARGAARRVAQAASGS